jgi:uncharacterized membrane protein YhaH (DUF805 family)
VRWYLAVLKNYVGFSGRARRTEFWMFVLVNAIVVTVINVIGRYYFDSVLPGVVYNFAVLIPLLAVWTRRLHDSGRPGGWVLIMFVPFIGVVVLVVLAALPGAVGANQYGPDPKRDVAAFA